MPKVSQGFSEEIDNTGDDMEYFLADYFGLRITRSTISRVRNGWRPQTDVFETREELMVIVEIAGVDREDISITLDKDVLVIRGVRRETHAHLKKRKYHQIEIDYGPFERIIKLPTYVQREGVKASLRDGFLIINCRKSSKPEVFREIFIK